MRKIKVIVMVILIVVSTVINVPMMETIHEVKAESIFKIHTFQLKRTGKCDVTLTWNDYYSAEGYEVYMKVGKGAFIKYKTTKENAINIRNLKMNTSYQFKVRGYEKPDKKKVYTSFSSKLSVKLKKTVYLTDILEYGNKEGNLQTFGDKAFTLCNVAYGKGFTNYLGHAGSIVYYLNDDFSTMTFDWGTEYPECIGYLIVYGDDEILFNGNNEEGKLPENLVIDVTNVNRLTFSFSQTGQNGRSFGYTGVGNIKLTYK